MYNYKSEYKSLGNNFFNRRFNIPIYQRLYVWENIQVKTLIDDLVRAYEHDDKHEYFLGGIVVVENGNLFDLIDGQQRFTTLKILREMLGDTGLTLDFKIRDNVWEHFKSNENIDDSDIQRMKEAKRELDAGLKKRKNQNDSDFLTYLKEQVKLVVTIVPNKSDLNKLFELINGRGEQLQQHEILKAKILSRININLYKYGKIWDICSNMNEFLEINIKKSLGENWKDHRFNDTFSSLFGKIENTKDKKIKNQMTISNILDPNNTIHDFGVVDIVDSEDEASTQYLSIISFEMFLLYALVSFEDIMYFEKMESVNIEFKDKNLIQIFEIVLLKNREEYIFDNFIKHMFRTRVKFDNYIIKNHKKLDDNSNETNHKISKVVKYKNGNNYSRNIEDIKSSNDLALLQSMLYHSHTRNTQEWIIPFLKNIDNTTNTLELLKDIDNYLYSQIGTSNTVLEKTYMFSKDNINIDCDAIVSYLKEKPIDNYHHISHYWFYKMDWIIWDLSNKTDTKFKFTARNSIEHIAPQNPQDENIDMDKVSIDYLNSFGNLFLVSVSQNSSVSNEGFKTKISKFVGDKDVKNLKLSLLSGSSSWGDDGVEKHFEDCILKIEKYFKCSRKSDMQ